MKEGKFTTWNLWLWASFDWLFRIKNTKGNKDFPSIEKLKVIPGKPSVYKKSKQKENRTEGNKGTSKFMIPNSSLLTKCAWA